MYAGLGGGAVITLGAQAFTEALVEEFDEQLRFSGYMGDPIAERGFHFVWVFNADGGFIQGAEMTGGTALETYYADLLDAGLFSDYYGIRSASTSMTAGWLVAMDTASGTYTIAAPGYGPVEFMSGSIAGEATVVSVTLDN